MALNRDFALACRNFAIEDQQKLAQHIWKRLGKKSRVPSGFLDLEGPSLFARRFYFSNGVWLTLNIDTVDFQIDRPLTYFDHNAELVADRFMLMRAFGEWVNAATALLKWE